MEETTDLLTGINSEPAIAPIRLRIFAAIIDLIILMLGCYGIASLFGQAYQGENGVGFELTGFPAVVAMAFGFLLVPVNEGLTGQTIGKRAVKIKVVKTDLSKTTLVTSVIRHLLDFIDCFLFIGLIIAAGKQNKQRIGDLVANTYVVKI